MGGLVTLLLAANQGSRASFGLPSPDVTEANILSSYGVQSHVLQASKRLSLDTTGSSAPMPSTAEQWRKAVADVKLKYANRKYRACSARCVELIAWSQGSTTVEPVYLVSLHFYAAVSLETCARPLSPSSRFRDRLLRDARQHYDQAEILIQKAEDLTTQQTRSSSSLSNASSSPVPDLCHDSQSEISTSPSSRRSSISSVDDGVKKLKLKPKKKVSFSGLPDLEIEVAQKCPPEPYIRPDSPTLGAEIFSWSKPLGTSHKAPVPESFPMPPTFSPSKKALVLRPASPCIVARPTPRAESTEAYTTAQLDSMTRMSAQIASLRSQIDFHRNAIDTLLSEPTEAQAAPEVPPLLLGRPFSQQSGRTTPTPDSPGSTFFFNDDEDGQIRCGPKAAFRPRTPEFRCATPEVNTISPGPPRASSSLSMFNTVASRPGTGMSMRSRADSVASNSTYRSNGSSSSDPALRERIERLRANGWQRKRFDSKKYEALRESVLDELNHN
ncbi:hypothetical protein Micbo1qcDRAFT_163193 [Microdochium bolleyi]|uniref:Uncharacterized protein n=1 Tax=Microdochium bolleyi TaxID=196109 RepID=A0A136J2S0_9PEZI|nr:hypothetical protein Micbo1qcDRAFT_163193 [Microdochium bolleyi]